MIAAYGIKKKPLPNWYAIDVALAVENMVLIAVSEGLGTCCLGSLDEKEVRENLKVPDNFEVLIMITVGYSVRNWTRQENCYIWHHQKRR
jgi:nitroreductase